MYLPRSKKIAQVTDLEIEAEDGINAKEELGSEGISVTLKDVSFRYRDQDEDAVSNFNITIKESEKVVVAGVNGSGKTTLLNILSGICRPSKGSVLYGDIPFVNLELESIRDLKRRLLR